MIESVIFDIDGTLVNSVDLHASAWVDAFRDYGHEVKFQDVRIQIGKGGDQLIPVFLSEKEMADFGEKLEKHRSQIFKARYLPRVTAFPGIRSLMKRLLTDGKQIALASSAKKDELARYTEIAEIDDLISAETSSDDAEKSKPHPDIFQAAMKRLGNKRPETIIVVGDTPYDAEAAIKIGLQTIGLLCGGWSEDELKQASCIAIYRDPADLLELLPKVVDLMRA
jgi:HAD superfamily hydrolase (TIGR01509 family)